MFAQKNSLVFPEFSELDSEIRIKRKFNIQPLAACGCGTGCFHQETSRSKAEHMHWVMSLKKQRSTTIFSH